MKKMLFCTIIVLTALFLFFKLCPAERIRPELVLADRLMESEPDSSLAILQRIGAPGSLSEKEHALYALLMAQSGFINHRYSGIDSLVRMACDYFVPGKDSLRKAQAYLCQGILCERMDNKAEAVKNYQKAAVAANATGRYKFLAQVYNRWGLLLDKQHIHREALGLQKKSLEYALLAKDTARQILVLRDIGATYTVTSSYEQALSYFKRAIQLSESANHPEYISDLYKNLALLYKIRGQYDLALDYIGKSVSLMKDSAALSSGYLLKGDIFIARQRYDSARYYLDLGREVNDLPSEAKYHSLMSRLSEKLGNYRESLAYANRYINYLFKIIDTDMEKSVVELQRKYDYSLIKNENNELRIARQQMHIFILVVSITSLVSTFLFLYFFFRKRSVKRAMKLELDRMQVDLVNERANYYKEKTIEAQRNLIKEQELSMQLSLKTEALRLQQERERELKDRIFKVDAIVQKINTFNLMKPLQRSKSESRFSLSFQELSDLEEAVNLCYDNFTDRLRAEFPKLKDDDIHLCCLLKMKVPNKNILSLLDTNELALKKRRYRIKHDKMNLSDEVSSLEEFLHSY